MADEPTESELSEHRYTKALWTRRLYAMHPNSAPRHDLAELFDALDNLPADERRSWYDDHDGQLGLVLRSDGEPPTAP